MRLRRLRGREFGVGGEALVARVGGEAGLVVQGVVGGGFVVGGVVGVEGGVGGGVGGGGEDGDGAVGGAG